MIPTIKTLVLVFIFILREQTIQEHDRYKPYRFVEVALKIYCWLLEEDEWPLFHIPDLHF